MNRAIKFRGWNKQGRKMVDLKALTAFALDATLSQDGLFLPFSEDIVLMQYTGLKDSRDVEIYENDIIEIVWIEDTDEPEWNKSTRHQVCWGGSDNYPAFDLKPPADEECNSLQMLAEGGFDPDNTFERFVVIGNIYENPELLNAESSATATTMTETTPGQPANELTGAK